MRLVGVISAYQESPHWLGTAAAGFARFCDAIVYADGAYSMYPSARARSHPDQAEAVTLACEAMDVECLVHRPRGLYYGQEVEKRNMTLRLAGTLDPDFVIVFDADEHVLRADPDRIRGTLEHTDRHVVTHTLLDGKDLMADPGLARHAQRTDAAVEWTIRTRQCYRWTDDLRYEHTHYFVGGTYEGEHHWLRGPDLCAGEQHRASPAEHLEAALVVNHRTSHRALVRRNDQAEYYRRRDAAGSERTPEVVAA